MSDEVAKSFEQQSTENAVKPEGQSVTLTITLHPNGKIEFRLPTNKVLAYGLLGAAQEQLASLSIRHDINQSVIKAKQGNGFAGLMKRMSKG